MNGRTLLGQVEEGAVVSVHPRGSEGNVFYIQTGRSHFTAQHLPPASINFIEGTVLQVVTHGRLDMQVFTPTQPPVVVSLSERTEVGPVGLPFVPHGRIAMIGEEKYIYPPRTGNLWQKLTQIFSY